MVKYTYDAWGKLLSTTGSLASTIGAYNPFRYRSYCYDTETGLYYLNSRYYDPEIGRFLSPDIPEVLTATPMGLTDKNLYAYCDNNPIVRVDDGGQFWHIIAGAAIGAFVSGVAQVVSNIVDDKPLTDGLATAMVSGAASGALASTGVGIVGMVAVNAAISMTENTVNQVIANKGFNNFDFGEVLVEGAIGAATGAMGGAGNGSKHLMNLGKQTVKRTVNVTKRQAFKAGGKEAIKALSYYGKNTVKYYKKVLKKVPRDLFDSIATNVLTSDRMVLQYRHALGKL